MQVRDDNKSHVTEINETMNCLKWLLQLFSIDSGARKVLFKEKCRYLIQACVTVVTFAALDIYTLKFKFDVMLSKLNITIFLTDLIQVVFDYFQYLIDIYFVYKYGREMCVEYYKYYECFDSVLDAVNYAEIKKRVMTLTIGIIVIFSIASIADLIAWTMNYGWYASLMYTPSYLFMFIKTLTNVDLTAQVINIECRLRVLGDIVQNYYSCADSLVLYLSNDDIKDCVCNKNWFYANNSSKSTEIKVKSQRLKTLVHNQHEMKCLTRCYLILTEQCVFISRMFGMRILLNSLSLLIDMVRFLNVVVRLAVGNQRTMNNDAYYLPVVSVTLRMLSCVVIVTSLVHHCERAYRQKERIASITTHILVNKNPDVALRLSLTELRDLVTSQPIVFTVAHFYILNYSFLLSMSSVVVTYTIILLQSM